MKLFRVHSFILCTAETTPNAPKTVGLLCDYIGLHHYIANMIACSTRRNENPADYFDALQNVILTDGMSAFWRALALEQLGHLASTPEDRYQYFNRARVQSGEIVTEPDRVYIRTGIDSGVAATPGGTPHTPHDVATAWMVTNGAYDAPSYVERVLREHRLTENKRTAIALLLQIRERAAQPEAYFSQGQMARMTSVGLELLGHDLK